MGSCGDFFIINFLKSISHKSSSLCKASDGWNLTLGLWVCGFFPSLFRRFLWCVMSRYFGINIGMNCINAALTANSWEVQAVTLTGTTVGHSLNLICLLLPLVLPVGLQAACFVDPVVANVVCFALQYLKVLIALAHTHVRPRN